MRREPGSYALRCLPVEDWPALHRRTWEQAFATGGLFDTPGRAANWRPHSIKKTQMGWGAWIYWRLSRSGLDPALVEASRPEDLVTREAVLAYVEQLRVISSSMTAYNRIQELYDAIRAMTPSAPEGRWDWLKNAFKKLRSEAHPSRNKMARLRTADELEELGFALMAEAETAPYWNYHDGTGMTVLQTALAFRDGLMIALLIRRPLRIKNFGSLAIGDNLVIDGEAVSFAFRAQR